MNDFLIIFFIGLIIESIIIFLLYRFNFRNFNYKSKLIKSMIISISLTLILIFSILFNKVVGTFNIATQKALIANISNDRENCELLIDIDKNEIIIDYSNSKQEIIPFDKKVENDFHNIMKLPETTSAEDITLNEKVSEITWRATPITSSSYINFLLAEGYKKVITYSTADFIEIYMQKENKAKRIIVTKTSLVTSDLFEDTLIPSIEELVNDCIINFKNSL